WDTIVSHAAGSIRIILVPEGLAQVLRGAVAKERHDDAGVAAADQFARYFARSNQIRSRRNSDQDPLVGISSGANLVAARKVARELVRGGDSGVIVTFLCDSAAKYLSEPFWDEDDSN